MYFNVSRYATWYKIPLLRRIAKRLIWNCGVDLPLSVEIGKNVSFPHNSVGTVIHDRTIIEDNVKIYQNVTLGRADVYSSKQNNEFKGFVIKRGTTLCAGAKIICKKGTLFWSSKIVIPYVSLNALLQMVLNHHYMYVVFDGCTNRRYTRRSLDSDLRLFQMYIDKQIPFSLYYRIAPLEHYHMDCQPYSCFE